MSKDYKVGRGKPPQSGQFQKGRSGNPAGRPRRNVSEQAPDQSAIDDVLRTELERKVRVKDANGTKKLTMLQVAIKAQLTSAAKGSPIAQRDIYRQAKELEARDSERDKQAALEKQESFERIARWRRQLEEDRAAAAAQGKEPDDPWPHPDDILLDPASHGWHVRGPVDAESVPQYEYFRMLRENAFWLFLDALSRRNRSDFLTRSYCAMMHIHDRSLPKRWQWGQDVLQRIHRSLILTPSEIEARKEQSIADSENFRVANRLPAPDADVHKQTDKIMRPLLRRQGYRSLAEFERAYAKHGPNTPWPKDAGLHAA